MGTTITHELLTAVREACRTPITVNGWWRDWTNGAPAWWDTYTTGGGAVAEVTTAGMWESCGRSLQLSGGTAEAYQDYWGLLQEGWRGLTVTVLARALRTTSNWELLIDYGTGGESAVLQGSTEDEFEDRAIKLTVPATADQMLLVLRWTSASGSVHFDRVQLTVGGAQVGWLMEQLEPLMLCEGVYDDNAAAFTDLPDARMVVIHSSHTSLSGGTNDTDTEDWATVADYWPTGWARTDAGSNGDRWTSYPSLFADEASGNFRLVSSAFGKFAQLDGKPTATVAAPNGGTFSTGDLECASLVFLHQRGPDPATRVAYPGGI